MIVYRRNVDQAFQETDLTMKKMIKNLSFLCQRGSQDFLLK